MAAPRHYVPAISRPLVAALFHEARRRGVPMTRLVDRLLRDALAGSPGWNAAAHDWPELAAHPPAGPACRPIKTPAPGRQPNHEPPHEHPMAITLTTDYSKKLGLPGFSSHQFSVSIQTELTDLERVPSEVARLYQLLQHAVDREIQQTGFVPGDGYGEAQRELPARSSNANGNGGRNGHHNGNGSVPRRGTTPANGGNGAWQCSEKQRRLLSDLSRELRLSEEDLDERAMRLFQRPARQLNKLSASGLITDLLEEAEAQRQSNGGTSKGHAAAHRNGGAA